MLKYAFVSFLNIVQANLLINYMKLHTFIIASTIILFPSLIQSQSKIGVVFENGSNWNRILKTAKSQNKLIFLECYTSWCTFCNKMEKEIYSDKNIGDSINSRYISFKVQIDTTKQDSDETKMMYKLAHWIKGEYNINEYPTYLFFSSDGTLIHKGKGFKKNAEFLDMARKASDSNWQYYTLLDKYLKGDRDKKRWAYLATTARSLGENKISEMISKDFIDNYLLDLCESELFTSENIKFVFSFTNSSMSKSFLFIFQNMKKLDSVLNIRNYSSSYIDKIIKKEEINPYLNCLGSGLEPDWNKIGNRIKNVYGDNLSRRNILLAKIDWYYNRDWSKYISYGIQRIKEYPLDTTTATSTVILNNIAWDGILLHSKDKTQIKTAIDWMEGVVRRNPSSSIVLDTYANLLYKIGRIGDALKAEERASFYSPHSKIYNETLNKMIRGEPTW